MFSSLLQLIFARALISLSKPEVQEPDSSFTWPTHSVSYGHGLFKRDTCTDAFGAGWRANTCTPGDTLCCVNSKQDLPMCQQALGLGWCCTQDDGCYADVQSACGQPGAVQCEELAEGISEACCPQYTTCASGYNASLTFARCNIQRTALSSLAAATKTISTALSSTPASSSTTSDSSTSAATSAIAPSVATPATESSAVAEIEDTTQSSGLSIGAKVGIGIGSGVAATTIVVLAWLLWRRTPRHADKSRSPERPAPAGEEPLALWGRDAKTPAEYSRTWAELPSDRPRLEMGGEEMRSPVELPTHR